MIPISILDLAPIRQGSDAAQAFDLYRILAEKERRARWQIFNEAGHFSFREQPKRFNEVVRSFIAGF